MKAIIVRYLPFTQKLNSRLKVIIDQRKPIIINTDSMAFDQSLPECLEMQAARMALETWGILYTTLQIGQLSNGDHVVTIGDKEIKAYKVDFQLQHGTDTYHVTGNIIDVEKWAYNQERILAAFSHVTIKKGHTGYNFNVCFSKV